MTKIIIKEIPKAMFDTSNKAVVFYDDNNKIMFSQAGSGDLAFSSFSHDSQMNMEIDKFNNYKVYMCFDELYNKLKNGNLDGDGYFRNMLFKNDVVCYKSDGFVSERNGEVLYCYLDIYKLDDKYLLKFLNEDPRERYCLEINTDRCKYGPYSFLFVDLFKSLINMDKQITIDEYIYKQKVLERKK